MYVHPTTFAGASSVSTENDGKDASFHSDAAQASSAPPPVVTITQRHSSNGFA